MSLTAEDQRAQPNVPLAKMAIRFVVLLGIVSLFGDMTYEGARSITGPYLAVLGASATVVGIVAGFGELVGYGLRLVSGYVSDRTGRYWPITLVGYSVNLLAVPLLALTGRWEVAALLMITERVGKALRTPARDAMLSHATAETGEAGVWPARSDGPNWRASGAIDHHCDPLEWWQLPRGIRVPPRSRACFIELPRFGATHVSRPWDL